jgi:uncharacterized protein with HEPN domain
MQRDVRAYLRDILDACDAITVALQGLNLEAYRSNRTIRSSVEREFIIIGEAMAGLARFAPALFAMITDGRKIVDFRNHLAHEYQVVNDALVWGIADRDVPALRQECALLLATIENDAPSA